VVADARFAHAFSLAVETVTSEDEAQLFQRVLDLARERHDGTLAAIAQDYLDRARARASKARSAARQHGVASESLLELARVAGRHPSHSGATRPPLAAV
jgi:hypothetical protein